MPSIARLRGSATHRWGTTDGMPGCPATQTHRSRYAPTSPRYDCFGAFEWACVGPRHRDGAKAR
jgi:hypothetical protein